MNGTITTVPESARVRITAAGYLTHQCPHVPETDHGTITIEWTCRGATIELHSLAAYLETFEDVRASHEAISACIRTNLDGLDGIENVTVTTTWLTGDLEVRVQAMP